MWGAHKLRMSAAWVDSVKPGSKPAEYRDTETRGLILRVEASGRKTWAARYVFGTRERRFTIGPFPEVKLSDARRKAEEVRGAVYKGIDSQDERSRLRLGETVAEVVQAWLSSEDTRHWRPRSRVGFETHLRLRLLPKLGHMKLSEVRRAHLRALFDGIARTHTRNRTFETARMLFGWAVRRELIEASPCAGIAKLHEPPRTRVLTDDEIRQVVRAFDSTRLGAYVRLLFLTGARRDEVLAMRWSDVDADRSIWTIPPEAEKTGQTRAEARKVALSASALELLAVQRQHNMARRLGRAPFVFCGPSGERLDRGAPKPVIYTLKGLRESGTRPSQHKLAKHRPVLIPEDFRLHDVRRTVADRMVNDLGLSAYVVDVGVLGHAKPKMIGIYAPSVPLKELRVAVETWSGELARILRERLQTRTGIGEDAG